MHIEEWEKHYILSTSTLRRISLYTGLSFNEVEQLPMHKYLLYNHDSWIDSWNSSKEGREFLKTLWRLQQTEADEAGIQRLQERRKSKS